MILYIYEMINQVKNSIIIHANSNHLNIKKISGFITDFEIAYLIGELTIETMNNSYIFKGEINHVLLSKNFGIIIESDKYYL